MNVSLLLKPHPPAMDLVLTPGMHLVIQNLWFVLRELRSVIITIVTNTWLLWDCSVRNGLVTAVLVLCPACLHLPVRNGLVNEVEFLGLIAQKW